MTIEDHYRNIAPRLTNWLLASGSQYHEACDLVQTVFLKICKMKDTLKDDAEQVSGLAFTMARNLRKNLARDNARMTFVGEIRDADEGEAGGVKGEGESLAARVASTGEMKTQGDAEYLRRRLQEAFKQLPPILSEAYTMFQVGEMSIKEIARQTGVSEGLVKVRIFRAKEKLRKILADLCVTY